MRPDDDDAPRPDGRAREKLPRRARPPAAAADRARIRAPTGADIETLIADFDPRRILFHGSGLLAVDKPAGIAVHASEPGELGLAELLAEWARLHPGALDISPGKPIHPIHLLDREATGVLLYGLTRPMRRRVQTAIAERRVVKRYLAIVSGPVEEEAEIQGRVRSKLRGQYRWMRSSLRFRRLHGDERLSLVEVLPQEGRTHQIRVLFAGAGRPLAGDLRYGKPKPARQFIEKFGVPGLQLHALEIVLPAEILGSERTLRAPLPRALLSVLEQKGWPVAEILGKTAAST
jgi:23S rRNA-/tRNA-specific pseudouridylate synthase